MDEETSASSAVCPDVSLAGCCLLKTVDTEPRICGYRPKKQLVFQREVNYLGD